MAGSIQIYKRNSQEIVHQRERAHSALSESKESIGGIDMSSKLSQNQNAIEKSIRAQRESQTEGVAQTV